MEASIRGLHHITAIAGNAKRNYDFYTKILGLRFVKKTVNFDDPNTYHFYYGDEKGSPGSILTFFPWEGIGQGRRGVGMATEFGYAVPDSSFDFWINRFEAHNVTYNKPAEKFNEKYLTFLDPDGLKIELVVPAVEDFRPQWTGGGIGKDAAIKGFHNVTLSLIKSDKTAEILTDIFGYRLQQSHVNRHRFVTDVVSNASIVDLVETPGDRRGVGAGGTIHHIAFCVKNDEEQLYFRNKLLEKGLDVTSVIDRNYFHSVYFREPGGVLFEIATENPGFTIDEPLNELGSHLKLPHQFESHRSSIEKALPVIE